MPALRIVAQCKIVTPMLSSGANQQEFEIRATEVKAGLRFWWRAFQPEDPKNLFVKEANLFGSTEASSLFKVQARYDPLKIPMWKPGDFVDIQGDPFRWGSGLEYVFFSIFDPFQKDIWEKGKVVRKGHQKRIKPKDDNPSKSGRPVAKPGGEFQIIINFTRDKDPDWMGDILGALWLLENLSGLGGRTRRGAGCFEITRLTLNDQDIDTLGVNHELALNLKNIPKFKPEPGQNPEAFIRKGIQTLTARWKSGNRAYTPGTYPPYTCFCEGLSDIAILWDKAGKNTRAMDVMNKIGVRMQQFRKKDPLEEAQSMHASLDQALQGISDPAPAPKFKTTITKAYMGLPIIYNFHEDPEKIPMLKFYDTKAGKKRNATFEVKGGYQENGEIKDGAERRASPVLISCHEKGGIPYAVICHFPGQLLPEKQRLRLEANYKDMGEIGGLYDVPDENYAVDLIKKISKEFDFPDTPLTPATPKLPGSLLGTTAPVPRPAQLTSLKKEPLDILNDSSIMEGKILVRLIGITQTKEKTVPCVRLYLDDLGNLKEEKGWTVKTVNLKLITGVKSGDLLIGVRNQQEPTRLDDPKGI